jgi:hypothetical protein
MKDVIIAVLGLLVFVLSLLLFQSRSSTFSPSPSTSSDKVTGVYNMMKMNKTTLEIIESLKLGGVPDDQVGTIIAMAQSRIRDELRAQGVKVETGAPSPR